MSWQDRLGKKLIDSREAARFVQSGQTIAASPFTSSPMTLSQAVIDRGRQQPLWAPHLDLKRRRVGCPAIGAVTSSSDDRLGILRGAV